MVSRGKMSYHTKIFILLLGFSWLMVVCFVAFQCEREKQFKIDKLDSQLQLYNVHLLDAISADTPIDRVLNDSRKPMDDIRVTITDLSGHVVFDNSLDTLPSENHLSRTEISNAIKYGHDYTLRRHSQSTDNTYFYSATRGGDIIIRSAVPYSLPLQAVLKTDNTFLWFMLFVTLGISIIGYFATRRLGRTITRLNDFAEKAEKGEKIYDDGYFPSDELGSISSHIVRLYARLQQATTDLKHEHKVAIHEEQEKIRIKKQLTNNINHELKTPVSSMLACLETLLDHPELPEEKRTKFIRMCHDNCERLGRLMADVSSITRMDDGSRLIEKEKLRLDLLIAGVVTDEKPHAETHGFNINNNVKDNLTVCGNAPFLESIFRNLIDNAITYSQGDNIKIKLTASDSDKYFFSVSDNGIGVPDEHIPHLFERFYRIDKGRSRKAGGTGLGLSIVKNSVQLHGGTISVNNRRDGGLEFHFSISRK
ncbi:cell wall metabolism sensor histidine kinase WalK [Prevotella sp. MGM1]|uniref:sensor histidine kinase n=1 Tax=Prevotella sp. MGM1 TaxID=2033405 RepID=UPI000CE9F8F2|nr:ATP-binding protein [Prevotella sp. MGM1]